MKIKTHKWTLALAAAGVVSLPSLANAQEAAAGADALAASTTLSGYVSTSYTMSDGDGADLGKPTKTQTKFKLDIVSLTLSICARCRRICRRLHRGHVDWAGRPTYKRKLLSSRRLTLICVCLLVTGIDLKVGYFGTVVGYEVYEYTDNAFFQRGLGFFMEPTHHTGVFASYQLTDDLGIAAGIVNNGGAMRQRWRCRWR